MTCTKDLNKNKIFIISHEKNTIKISLHKIVIKHYFKFKSGFLFKNDIKSVKCSAGTCRLVETLVRSGVSYQTFSFHYFENLLALQNSSAKDDICIHLEVRMFMLRHQLACSPARRLFESFYPTNSHKNPHKNVQYIRTYSVRPVHLFPTWQPPSNSQFESHRSQKTQLFLQKKTALKNLKNLNFNFF